MVWVIAFTYKWMRCPRRVKWQAIEFQHFIIARDLLKGYVKIGEWE
jgi:hypothetical protein